MKYRVEAEIWFVGDVGGIEAESLSEALAIAERQCEEAIREANGRIYSLRAVNERSLAP